MRVIIILIIVASIYNVCSETVGPFRSAQYYRYRRSPQLDAFGKVFGNLASGAAASASSAAAGATSAFGSAVEGFGDIANSFTGNQQQPGQAVQQSEVVAASVPVQRYRRSPQHVPLELLQLRSRRSPQLDAFGKVFGNLASGAAASASSAAAGATSAFGSAVEGFGDIANSFTGNQQQSGQAVQQNEAVAASVPVQRYRRSPQLDAFGKVFGNLASGAAASASSAAAGVSSAFGSAVEGFGGIANSFTGNQQQPGQAIQQNEAVVASVPVQRYRRSPQFGTFFY